MNQPIQPNNTNARWNRSHTTGKILFGLLIATIGGVLLAREFGANIPHWLLSWKMFLIAIGTISLIKHRFQHWWGAILILIGSVFLLGDVYPEMVPKRIIFPTVLIAVGLMIMLKPRRRKSWKRYGSHSFMAADESTDNADYIKVSSVMGGVSRKITSQNLKGGEISAVMGGGEFDLTQADIHGTVIISIETVLGGVKLMIPSSWEVQSELSTVLGGVEDKRSRLSTNPDKVLLIKGTAILGGVEINSF